MYNSYLDFAKNGAEPLRVCLLVPVCSFVNKRLEVILLKNQVLIHGLGEGGGGRFAPLLKGKVRLTPYRALIKYIPSSLKKFFGGFSFKNYQK